MTSSSFLIGMLRTLYFLRKSLLNGELISFRLMCDGAEKCLLRFFRRPDDTRVLNFIFALFFEFCYV